VSGALVNSVIGSYTRADGTKMYRCLVEDHRITWDLTRGAKARALPSRWYGLARGDVIEARRTLRETRPESAARAATMAQPANRQRPCELTKLERIAYYQGARLGDRFNQDPFAACRALDIELAWGGEWDELRELFGMSKTTHAACHPPTGSIILFEPYATMGQAAGWLAHELGHSTMHSVPAQESDPAMKALASEMSKAKPEMALLARENMADAFAWGFLSDSGRSWTRF